MITNILIDVDNTLLDFNKCAEAAIKTGFLKWNIEYSEKVFPVFLEVNDSLWRKIETGEIDKKTLYQLRWKTIFERLGINADGPTFEQDFRNIFSDSKEPVDGAYELLDHLLIPSKLVIQSLSRNFLMRALKNSGIFQKKR